MEKKKIAVAMSGGVDSSVAAALLLDQGHDICGITMIVSSDIEGNPEDLAAKDAKKVCDQLGIKHFVVDLRDAFMEKVIKPFAKEYSSGNTPNPCVICNERIKFGALMDYANELGYPNLATGHYLNLVFDDKNNLYKIFGAKDKSKDQAYMLYRLNQKTLSKLVFPLARYEKTEVVKMAHEKNLASADRVESQDICFIPDEDSYADYLIERSLIKSEKTGYFVDVTGNEIKEHDGVHKYTIGQRKGLGIALGYPAYVIDIDKENNNIIVGKKDMLFSKKMIVTDVSWLSGNKVEEIECNVKIRYSNSGFKAKVINIEENDYIVEFEQPVRAITPGQSAVFYKNDELLGGGFIKPSEYK
jgi:tRNA-specific 2-thiouridylase